jgi:hypothetical protein
VIKRKVSCFSGVREAAVDTDSPDTGSANSSNMSTKKTFPKIDLHHATKLCPFRRGYRPLPLQSAWQTFDEWQSQASIANQEALCSLSTLIRALAPDREWISFAATLRPPPQPRTHPLSLQRRPRRAVLPSTPETSNARNHSRAHTKRVTSSSP